MVWFKRSLESRGEELFGLLSELITNQRIIMGDFTALNAALASLSSAVAANTAAVSGVTTLVGSLTATTDQAQVDAATTSVSAAVTQVNTNTANLNTLSHPSTVAVSTVAPAAVASS
jgi:hypothetical protein